MRASGAPFSQQSSLPRFTNMKLLIRYSGLTDKRERVTQHGRPNKMRKRGGMAAGYSLV